MIFRKHLQQKRYIAALEKVTFFGSADTETPFGVQVVEKVQIFIFRNERWVRV